MHCRFLKYSASLKKKCTQWTQKIISFIAFQYWDVKFIRRTYFWKLNQPSLKGKLFKLFPLIYTWQSRICLLFGVHPSENCRYLFQTHMLFTFHGEHATKELKPLPPAKRAPFKSQGGEPTGKQRVGCPLIGRCGFKAHVTNKALASVESSWQDAGVPFGAHPWPRQRANMTWTRAFCGRINHLPKVPSYKKAKSVVRPAKYLWCTKVLKSSPFFPCLWLQRRIDYSNVFTLCLISWQHFYFHPFFTACLAQATQRHRSQ